MPPPNYSYSHSKHAAQINAALVYWLFWTAGQLKTANVERCFLWAPLICLTTGPPKGIQFYRPPTLEFHQPGKTAPCHRRGDWKSGLHPGKLCHNCHTSCLFFWRDHSSFLKIISFPLRGLHSPFPFPIQMVFNHELYAILEELLIFSLGISHVCMRYTC